MSLLNAERAGTSSINPHPKLPITPTHHAQRCNLFHLTPYPIYMYIKEQACLRAVIFRSVSGSLGNHAHRICTSGGRLWLDSRVYLLNPLILGCWNSLLLGIIQSALVLQGISTPSTSGGRLWVEFYLCALFCLILDRRNGL